MTLPSHRDTDLPARMLDRMFGFALEKCRAPAVLRLPAAPQLSAAGIDRTADVVAVGEAKVISLREPTLSELIASESRLAARFLLNLARIACLKLAADDQPQR
ncbi:MAG TPA: hypothetical protein VLB05_16270 [Dongiaceae bacterium]|nr:hypothetical protein [Dongiaceae bacterium]